MKQWLLGYCRPWRMVGCFVFGVLTAAWDEVYEIGQPVTLCSDIMGLQNVTVEEADSDMRQPMSPTYCSHCRVFLAAPLLSFKPLWSCMLLYCFRSLPPMRFSMAARSSVSLSPKSSLFLIICTAPLVLVLSRPCIGANVPEKPALQPSLLCFHRIIIPLNFFNKISSSLQLFTSSPLNCLVKHVACSASIMQKSTCTVHRVSL